MPDERLIVSTDIATLLAAADAKAARAALGSLAARVLGAADLDTGGSLCLDEVGNYAIAADIGEDWDGTLRIAANREGVWFFDNRTRVEASIYIGGVDSARKVPVLAVVMFVNVTSDAGYSTAVVLPTGGLDTGKTLALAEDFVATNHNELAGLQGGSETERYHITSDEQALIGTALQPTNLPWSIANGGTGAATAPLALDALGGTAVGIGVFSADTKADAQTAIGIVQITPAAYTDLVTAGTVDATTLYLLCE